MTLTGAGSGAGAARRDAEAARGPRPVPRTARQGDRGGGASRRSCSGPTRSRHPRAVRRRRPPSRCCVDAGLRGARPGGRRLLRPHLDQHRPARRRQEAADPPARRARAVRGQRHPDRRARAVVHRGAALRPARPAARRPPRASPSPARRARSRSCSPRPPPSAPATAGRCPDLSDVTAVVQPHCHHHSVMTWTADRRLLTDAGAQFSALAGCCGLAGNFGMEKGHYDVSVAVAENALLPGAARRGARGRLPGRRLLVPHAGRPPGRRAGRAPGGAARVAPAAHVARRAPRLAACSSPSPSPRSVRASP